MATLPPIPAKRYFTISEVALLCDVKPHVLRYWEQEFAQLRPMKRRGNRRYYQRHELLMVRRIRSLLYDEGFTIQGARNQLRELRAQVNGGHEEGAHHVDVETELKMALEAQAWAALEVPMPPSDDPLEQVRQELLQIRSLLSI